MMFLKKVCDDCGAIQENPVGEFTDFKISLGSTWFCPPCGKAFREVKEAAEATRRATIDAYRATRKKGVQQ